MGGSGATACLDHSAIVPYLHKAGRELFGHLGRMEWEFHWSGYFAVTTDHLPHVHEPERNLHISVGCNGRGIAVSTSLGIQIANRILGASAAELAVPVSSIKTVHFHMFRGIGVKAATAFKRLQDRRG
jgi:glycine/D-amino acid oxidase-like deaminating enzyme